MTTDKQTQQILKELSKLGPSQRQELYNLVRQPKSNQARSDDDEDANDPYGFADMDDDDLMRRVKKLGSLPGHQIPREEYYQATRELSRRDFVRQQSEWAKPQKPVGRYKQDIESELALTRQQLDDMGKKPYYQLDKGQYSQAVDRLTRLQREYDDAPSKPQPTQDDDTEGW